MSLHIEIDREEDGRWIAEIPDLPGVLAYGATSGEAIDRAKALALRVIASRVEKGQPIPFMGDIFRVGQTPLVVEQSPVTDPT